MAERTPVRSGRLDHPDYDDGVRRDSPRSQSLRVHATRAGAKVADLLSRVGLGSLTRSARLLLARVTGDELIVDAHGARIAGSYSRHYQYLIQLPGGPHPYQLELFLDHIDQGMTVLDVGAHIGTYTTLAAQRVGRGGNVVAVEPDPRNVATIRRNLALNGIEDRVEIIEAVAGDSGGTVRFFFDEAEATGTMGSRWRDPVAESREVEVPSIRLDDELGELTPDVVKIDVQGAEVATLQGMRKILERGTPSAVFVELNQAALERAGSESRELLAVLAEAGLKAFLIDEARRETTELDGGAPEMPETENLICLPR